MKKEMREGKRITRVLAWTLLCVLLFLSSCAEGSISVVPAPQVWKTPETEEPVPVEKIELNLSSLTLEAGEAGLLVATVLPLNAASREVRFSSSDETVAKVNGRGRITTVGKGDALITAETVEGGFTAQCSVHVTGQEHYVEEDDTVHVEKVVVSPDVLSMTVGDEAVLTASVLPENAVNRKVSWINSNTRAIELGEDGKIKAVGSGRAVVTAVSEDGNVSAACEIVVKATLQTLTFPYDAVSLSTGAMLQMTALPEPADLPDLKLTYRSSNSAVVTVDNSGLLIALGTGSATVSVSASGLSAQCTVTVTGDGAGTLAALTVRQKELTVVEGESITPLLEKVPGSAADTLTYQSADPSIAFISPEGIVTGIRPGQTTVTVSAKNGSVRRSCPVTVEELAPHRIYLNKNEATLMPGETLALETGLSGALQEGETILFASSDLQVASVDANGLVTARGTGNAVISAYLSLSGYTAVCNLTVSHIPVQSVTLDRDTLSLSVGQRAKLTANVTPANASVATVSFFSDNTGIASVDDQGNVIARAPGEANITVQTLDGKKTAVCHVAVFP